MNDEIKEILDNTLEYLEGIDETRNTKILTTNETNILLDYITNLQKENEELRNNQKYHKNNVFSLEYDKETLVQMCNDLQEENEDLKDRLKVMEHFKNSLLEENERLKELNICVGCENNPDYKSRCEKAIEYIMSDLITEWDIKNDGCVSGSDLPADAITPLLNILYGGNE